MNIVINSSPWIPTDIPTIFGNLQNVVEEGIHYVDASNLPSLLKTLGVFKSTSEAVRAGRTGPIPSGYTTLRASKKVVLYIWNPSE